MTRQTLIQLMDEVRECNHEVFRTFYLRYSSCQGRITTNNWGEMSKFEKVLEEAEKSNDRVGDSLPIELLVLVDDRCVHCWTKNQLWNGVDYPEEDSHVYTNVPLVGYHWFVDPKDWLNIDNREKPVPEITNEDRDPYSSTRNTPR